VNRNFLGGREIALFFIAIICIGILPKTSIAATNIWDEWQTAEISDGTVKHNLIVELQNEFSIELWHYSSSNGYWGNNYVKIYDSQVFDNAEKLATAVNANVEFEMPLPQEIISIINSGYNVSVEYDTNGTSLENIFNLNKPIDFKYVNNKLIFKAFPKFNFDTNYNYKDDFVTGLNKAIPFVVAPYGRNRYAIWSRSGKSLGAAEGYFNPDNPTELGPQGTIHPSQIVNNRGHLANGFDVLVDRENGTYEWMNSNNISVGYNTFSNAGAVAVHFDYPVKLSFYKGENVANGPDVAVTKIEKTSYPANQGVIATVSVQNLTDQPQETTLDFSIPNITDASETVALEANETKTVDFYFQTPGSGPLPMTAHANKNKAFKERNYNNNKITVNAVIETPPQINETQGCGETIRWTETDYHTIVTPCKNHGSHSHRCNHTFTYETTLTITHNVLPKILKSGYGFQVNADTSISTKMVSNSGCKDWGNNRLPTKIPKPPTTAEVRLNYSVSNSLGTQPYVVTLESSAQSNTTSTFITAENPISVKNSRSIFTDVSLKGTIENPFTHFFDIYISGGGVNGVEFCKKIAESFVISGSMYDDDGTSN
jgi:hypothetical protein